MARGTRKKRNTFIQVGLVFGLGFISLFCLAQLPWFQPDIGRDPNNPYDLGSLETMNGEERQQTVRGWLEEWRALPKEQQQERADQYLDSVVNYVSDKLGFENKQRVEMQSLVKGAALIAHQLRIDQEALPKRREIVNGLREQVLEQLDQILTIDQRLALQELVRNRRQMGRMEYAPLRDGPPEKKE